MICVIPWRCSGKRHETLSDSALLQAIHKLTPDGVHAGGRPHYSFLKAAAKGWQEHEALLGQQLAVDGENIVVMLLKNGVPASLTKSSFIMTIR